jgi:hypothetical protein
MQLLLHRHKMPLNTLFKSIKTSKLAQVMVPNIEVATSEQLCSLSQHVIYGGTKPLSSAAIRGTKVVL